MSLDSVVYAILKTSLAKETLNVLIKISGGIPPQCTTLPPTPTRFEIRRQISTHRGSYGNEKTRRPPRTAFPKRSIRRLFSFSVRNDRIGADGSRGIRLARLRASSLRASGLRASPVRRPGTVRQVLRRGIRPEPVVLIRVRRARPPDRRLQEPAREPPRRRGARIVQPGRPGRHQEDSGLHRGPAQRFQRGRHQRTVGQSRVRRPARVPRRQSVRPRPHGRVPGRRQGLRARLSGRQGVRRARLPLGRVPSLPLRDLAPRRCRRSSP